MVWCQKIADWLHFASATPQAEASDTFRHHRIQRSDIFM
jgi:hypothetical protein